MNSACRNGINHQYNVISSVLLYHIMHVIFSGWSNSEMGNFPVPLAKDRKNQERRSLAGMNMQRRLIWLG